MKKIVLALAIIGALSASVEPSKAQGFKFVADAATYDSSVSAGVWIAGGIIGVAAALCIYDIWLKANGFKNWDGSPKVIVRKRRHR